MTKTNIFNLRFFGTEERNYTEFDTLILGITKHETCFWLRGSRVSNLRNSTRNDVKCFDSEIEYSA